MADEAEARLGTRLGNYLLRGIIGRGGMGIVYRAEHAYIGKPFAVKVLYREHFEKPGARERFLNEARAAAVVNHPNIVGVTDFGEAPDGTVFLVMAHVEGVSLERVLRTEGRIGLFRSLSIVSQVARAMAAAHDKGLVHRDLKPDNIMLQPRQGRRELVREIEEQEQLFQVVEPEGPFDFVTLLDFGAAKFFDSGPQGGVVIGTPIYMAPETARTGVADARADIYALGVIFYEMLTGSPPFDGDNAVEIMVKHVQDEVEPPRVRAPTAEITPEAERVVARLLEKEPERRYQSMIEVYADLQRCYGAVRFRRFAVAPGEGTRRPIPLTNVKRRPGSATVKPEGSPGATPAAPVAPPPSAPIPLTQRKSGRHKTLPFGFGTPTPTPVKKPGA